MPTARRSARSAANIRALRPPDPYKQKGIRITGERLKKKAGKAGSQGRRVNASRRRKKEKSWQENRLPELSRNAHRERIHRRVRQRVSGTPERPRLCVYRSLDHIYAQVIDDRSRHTLVSASSIDKETRKKIKGGGNMAAAKIIGKMIAERAIAAGIQQVVFDRGGYKYHGRVEALAQAAREAGLKF